MQSIIEWIRSLALENRKRRRRLMVDRFWLAVELPLILSGALTMQACFEEHTYRSPSYAPAPYPGYGPYGVYTNGDYDRDRHWHNSDWWVEHDHNWVHQHHPNWMTASKH